MDCEDFDGIVGGLNDALAYARGDASRGRVARSTATKIATQERSMQGGELKALRRLTGMSKAEFAVEIGMARETIGAMERGQAPIERRTELAARWIAEHSAAQR